MTQQWGSPVERERRNRIRVAVYAFAYECRDEALISDDEYDRLARSIKPTMVTGNPVIDMFFQHHYSPDTAMWIHKHPALHGIAGIYSRWYIQ